MIEVDLTKLDDGSTIGLGTIGRTVTLSVTSSHAPTSAPVRLTLPEIEALQKALGKMAAKLRGEAAKPNG